MMNLSENPVFMREFRLRTRGPKILIGPVLTLAVMGLLWYLSYSVLPAFVSNVVSSVGRVAPVGGLSSAVTPKTILMGGVAAYLSLIATFIMPAMLAITFARERENQTLDFLLLTPMRPRDIFLGKLVSVSSPIWLSALVTIPIMVLAPGPGGTLCKGVIPVLIWGILILQVLGKALLALSLSVLCKRVVAAVVATYGLIIFGLPILEQIVWTLVTYGARYFGVNAFSQFAMNQPSPNPLAFFGMFSQMMMLGLISSFLSALVVLVVCVGLAFAAVRSLERPPDR